MYSKWSKVWVISLAGLAVAAPKVLAQNQTASQAQETGPGLVRMPVYDRPKSAVFGPIYDELPEDGGVADPWMANGHKALVVRATLDPTAQAIYKNLCDLLLDPGQEQPVWKEFINPFVWLQKLGGKGESWFEKYKSDQEHRYDLCLMIPLRYDYDASSDPKRAEAKRDNNLAVEGYSKSGDAQAAMTLLMKAAFADPHYAVAMFNAGLLQAAGSNWTYSIKLLSSVEQRDPKSPLIEFSHRWLPQLKLEQALLALPSGGQVHLFWEDLDAAMVLCQLGQYRAAVSLAADAASYPMFLDRPHAYLVTAFAAACAKKDDLAWSVIIKAHATLDEDTMIMDQLYVQLKAIRGG